MSGSTVRNILGHLSKQQGLCAYCETGLTERNVTLEHIIPRSWGGHESGRNTLLACGPCNGAKSALESIVSNEFEKTLHLPDRAAVFVLLCMRGPGKSKRRVHRRAYGKMAAIFLREADHRIHHLIHGIPRIPLKVRKRYL